VRARLCVAQCTQALAGEPRRLTARAARPGLLRPLVRRLAPRARLARAAVRCTRASRGRTASDLAALGRLAEARARRPGGGPLPRLVALPSTTSSLDRWRG
jgi:hypothetical protein